MTELERQQAHYKAVHARIWNPVKNVATHAGPLPPIRISIKPIWAPPATLPPSPVDLEIYRNTTGIVHRILREIAREYDVEIDEMKSERRSDILVKARHAAMRRLWAETLLSTVSIGYVFNRDHSTVLHALRRTARSRALAVKRGET